MAANFFEMIKLVAIDAHVRRRAGSVVTPLAQFKRAAFAVLKRNFVGYFANPTGYVFLCLFVFLTSAAAFWPHDFFIANLANLDQLNKYMPLILLVFVPAITMSLWADERRQGTDELLLTLPAADFDIVIGKYLAAAAIFTVSLCSRRFGTIGCSCRWRATRRSDIVDIDTGLFFVTYLGYWLMGLSMLAIGMVASFLTPNLTVSFILGALFNAIPVMTYYADVLIPASVDGPADFAVELCGSQFDDFGRGVISLSSTAFFVLIILLGIYLSMVLIGKRHWLRHDAVAGADGAEGAGAHRPDHRDSFADRPGHGADPGRRDGHGRAAHRLVGHGRGAGAVLGGGSDGQAAAYRLDGGPFHRADDDAGRLLVARNLLLKRFDSAMT